MGGSVTTGQQQTNQNQTQSTSPWGLSGGLLASLLGKFGNINSDLTGNESSALNQLNALGAAGNPFGGGIGNVANTLLSGGGANNQAGVISDAYQQYQKQLNPYLQSSFLDPMKTPGFGDALSTINSDISNQINSQFAAAGRDLSGMNTQSLARGLSQGEGQLLANQYNQNVQNQLGAMGSLYGAGNTTGGLLTGLNQLGLQNMQAGIGAAGAATAAQQYGPLLQLQAAAAQRGITMNTLLQQLGATGQLGQMFGTTTGTGTGTTQQQSPLWQQLVGGALGGFGLLGGMGAFGKNGWLNFGGTG